jgi:predicted phage terminase large subunit-like protein
LRRSMGTVRFNREMRNMVGAEDSSIKENWIKYVPQVELLIRKEWRVAAFLDPSGKANERNDFKAITVVGKDMEAQLIDVLHAWIRHATINAMWDMVWQIDEEFGCGMGVETNMFEDFLIDSYKAHAEKAGRYVRLIKAHHTTEKIARVVNRLQPLIEFGKLRFVKGQSDQDILVEQLIYIDDPNVHDDGPDSLEGAVAQVQGVAGVIEFESTGQRRDFTRMRAFMSA